MKARRVLQDREGWRSALIMPGALSAIVCLAQRMLQLLANNWADSTERVNICIFILLSVFTSCDYDYRCIFYIMEHL